MGVQTRREVLIVTITKPKSASEVHVVRMGVKTVLKV